MQQLNRDQICSRRVSDVYVPYLARVAPAVLPDQTVENETHYFIHTPCTDQKVFPIANKFKIHEIRLS